MRGFRRAVSAIALLAVVRSFYLGEVSAVEDADGPTLLSGIAFFADAWRESAFAPLSWIGDVVFFHDESSLSRDGLLYTAKTFRQRCVSERIRTVRPRRIACRAMNAVPCRAES
jgi:hypothetical protein